MHPGPSMQTNRLYVTTISQRLVYFDAVVVPVACLQVATAKSISRTSGNWTSNSANWCAPLWVLLAVYISRVACTRIGMYRTIWRQIVVPEIPGTTLIGNYQTTTLPNFQKIAGWNMPWRGPRDEGQKIASPRNTWDSQIHMYCRWKCSGEWSTTAMLTDVRLAVAYGFFCWIFDAEVMRVEIRLAVVVSLRPKGAAFGQAGSTRLDSCTCTHGRCDVYIRKIGTHGWCRAMWILAHMLRDVDASCTCTHGRCHAMLTSPVWGRPPWLCLVVRCDPSLSLESHWFPTPAHHTRGWSCDHDSAPAKKRPLSRTPSARAWAFHRFGVWGWGALGRRMRGTRMLLRVKAPRAPPRAPPCLSGWLGAQVVGHIEVPSKPRSAILTHAAQHAFAASLLDLDCAGTSTVDGDGPSTSQLLSEAPVQPPHTSRVPARP